MAERMWLVGLQGLKPPCLGRLDVAAEAAIHNDLLNQSNRKVRFAAWTGCGKTQTLSF
jgi:hypothetical protein